MLALYIEAPFAAFRTFTAGWYRPTATFITPSAVYGLVLNLAGIESRLTEQDASHPGTVPATLTRQGLPTVRMAIGAAAAKRVDRDIQEWRKSECYPHVTTIFQQLHNYPVGTSGSSRAATAFGNKYNITPIRRELLVNLRAVVVLDQNEDLETRVRLGLNGGSTKDRYGLPFLGDNSLLPDRIEVLDEAIPAHWFERLTKKQAAVQPRTTRFTIWINRADMSQTKSDLFAPTKEATSHPPEDAWISVGPTSEIGD